MQMENYNAHWSVKIIINSVLVSQMDILILKCSLK